MRLLVSWVRDFVAIDVSPDVLAETLALCGFEVASIDAVPAIDPPPWDAAPRGPDAVIDFEVTANRPDCLSVIGFAREIRTAFGVPLRHLSAAPTGVRRPSTTATLRVELDDVEACPRYAAAVAEVAPTHTPPWMAARLLAAGIRPINPIVDVTNYVLIERGQPMHAFDLSRLTGGELRIRGARKDERLVTLDGVDRRLDEDMLVIADATGAQAIAGVMGGAQAEVSAHTRLVAFESACFEPTSIRRTSKRLGLKTEASARFERGADIGAPVVALERALELMEAIGAGARIGAPIDRYPTPRPGKTIALRRDRLARVLGQPVPDGEVTRILTSLDLGVRSAPDGWSLDVPTFRVDLTREVDLIEEVGRHHGFDKLEPTFPAMMQAAAPSDARVARDRVLRDVATASGLSEAVTFGFIEQGAAAPFVAGGVATGTAPEALVRVGNPLSAKFDVLRPSLLPGLIDAVAHNRRHGRRDIALFEIGARFTPTDGETRSFAAAWTGLLVPEHWSRSGRDADLYDATGLVERLGAALRVPTRVEPTTVPFLVAGQAAALLAGETRIGLVGCLATRVAEARGIPRQDRVVVVEIDLDRLGAAGSVAHQTVRPLPRYPSVVRDLSVVVSDRLSAAIIRGTIQAAAADAPAPLASLLFVDRYTGRGVEAGTVSVSVRLTFQSEERTLTDGEVHGAVERILAALARQHGAVQR